MSNLELESVHGVGPKTKEKLIEKGISTVENLAILRPEELSDILGLSTKQCKDIVNSAKEIALDKAIVIKTGTEVKEYQEKVVKKISTGSSDLDNILSGGIKTDALTGISGQYSSGKTQVCFTIAMNCIKSGRKVAWVETEPGTFVASRLEEICKANGVKINLDKDIIIVPAGYITSPHQQYLAYERINQVCQKGEDIGLLVIDSFSSKFRSYYTGREQLPDRSEETSRHIGFLENLASKYNMAILITVQVMGIPDAGAQLGALMKVGHKEYPVGGNVLMHSTTYWLDFRQVKKDEWQAELFDSPDLPRKVANFKITVGGVKDVSKRAGSE